MLHNLSLYLSFEANNKNHNLLTQSVQGQLGLAFLHENGTDLYPFYRVGVTKVI